MIEEGLCMLNHGKPSGIKLVLTKEGSGLCVFLLFYILKPINFMLFLSNIKGVGAGLISALTLADK